MTGRSRGFRPLIRAGKPFSSRGLLPPPVRRSLGRISLHSDGSGAADPRGRESLAADSAGDDALLTFGAAHIEAPFAIARATRAASWGA